VLQISKNRNSVLRPVKNSRSVLRQSLTHRRAAVVRDSIVLGWDQTQNWYSRKGPIPKLVLQERTNSKTGTPGKDQFQNWYSRKGPIPKLVLQGRTKV